MIEKPSNSDGREIIHENQKQTTTQRTASRCQRPGWVPGGADWKADSDAGARLPPRGRRICNGTVGSVYFGPHRLLLGGVYPRLGPAERDGRLVTAVVENLNILEVVRAERIVMQLSISIPGEPGPIAVSVAGSGFEGLRLAGAECRPKLNGRLQQQEDQNDGGGGLLRWEDVRGVGRAQGEILVNGSKGLNEEAHQWAVSAQRWMTSDPPPAGRSHAQASLIDALGSSGASRCHGHIAEIPGFGQIVFGELSISRDAVQLTGIRAELGCLNGGRISVCCGGGGGSNDD